MSRKSLSPGRGILRPQRKDTDTGHSRPDIAGFIMVPAGYDPERDGPYLNVSLWAMKNQSSRGTFFSANVQTEADYDHKVKVMAKKSDEKVSESLKTINQSLL